LGGEGAHKGTPLSHFFPSWEGPGWVMPIPDSRFPVPCSLFPVPDSRFPIPCSLLLPSPPIRYTKTKSLKLT